jgi:predicted nucleotidyltransferase
MNGKFQNTSIVFKEYDVKQAAVFGSYARGDQRINSDIDILIKLSRGTKMSLLRLIRMENKLKKILKKKIDLVTFDSLNRHIKPGILKEMKVIYERR